ncbi:MAG: NAD(P)/FAD-dependent oxidoreductase [Planctomycetia bacterium]|nr:NAD(P)/FAD-dependent oxidoreductase [Planctomycetia bacterium]RLT14565.1 MAG: NAD(P)/FAD-dependent oxidoreductase [Planctomycetota bacterium]
MVDVVIPQRPIDSRRLPDRTDVVVIGGGPAGATTATLLAQKGHRVTLLERERFPRFHIGESLIPETFWVLERLGLLPQMRASQFVEKHSVQFVNEKGTVSEPFYFADHKPQESSRTWQVVRSEFDEMMLRNAAQQGVDVHEGMRVVEVLFEQAATGQRATGVRVQDETGREQTLVADVVVDASGQGAMIMSRLGLREWDPELKKAALWTYWKGASRGTGRDQGATLVMQLADKQGWFWYIPLHDGTVSVGVVAAYDYLFKDRDTKNPELIYAEEMTKCLGLGSRIESAEQVGPVRVAKEYSYRSQQVAGDGWVLVGDAFGFLDPLYSSGILLALKSGELAADAIAAGLAVGDTSAARLGAWGPDYIQGMERMKRLVCEFYNGFNFGKFVKRHPSLRGHITDLLIGDLFSDRLDEIIEPLRAMRAEESIGSGV